MSEATKKGDNMKFKLVNGTGNDDKAPKPRKGLMRVLYVTVEALGDNVSRKEIEKYIPAAIDDVRQAFTEKQVTKGLYALVYRGYLLQPKKDRYSIAPLSYYNQRSQELSAGHKRGHRQAKAEAMPAPQPVVITQINWPVVALFSALSFSVGLAIGLGL